MMPEEFHKHFMGNYLLDPSNPLPDFLRSSILYFPHLVHGKYEIRQAKRFFKLVIVHNCLEKD